MPCDVWDTFFKCVIWFWMLKKVLPWHLEDWAKRGHMTHARTAWCLLTLMPDSHYRGQPEPYWLMLFFSHFPFQNASSNCVGCIARPARYSVAWLCFTWLNSVRRVVYFQMEEKVSLTTCLSDCAHISGVVAIIQPSKWPKGNLPSFKMSLVSKENHAMNDWSIPD